MSALPSNTGQDSGPSVRALRFRAILCSPSVELERPLQTLHPTHQMAEQWAIKILAGRKDDCFVRIYEIVEHEVDLVLPSTKR
jgi:hypothetical protein